MQVQLAADLRKLEALYSQHQRSQHRMRDRLKYLASTETRLAKEENLYAENIRRRDSHSRTVMEKGKEKILVELTADGKTFTAKDSEKIKDRLLEGVKEVTRDSSAKFPFGFYRGFEVYVERATTRMSGKDGFQLSLRGAGEREFRPGNLFYDFEEKFSLAGLFQRMDNFLAKGLDEAVETQRENARQEKAELETVRAALGKEFPQQEELALARENHSAVIRELQRMQDDSSYISTWTPKTSLGDEQPTTAEAPQPQEQNREGIKEPSAEHIEALPVVETSTPEENTTPSSMAKETAGRSIPCPLSTTGILLMVMLYAAPISTARWAVWGRACMMTENGTPRQPRREEQSFNALSYREGLFRLSATMQRNGASRNLNPKKRKNGTSLSLPYPKPC